MATAVKTNAQTQTPGPARKQRTGTPISDAFAIAQAKAKEGVSVADLVNKQDKDTKEAKRLERIAKMKANREAKEAKISALRGKEAVSTVEKRWIASHSAKVEDASPSKVYKRLKAIAEDKETQGAKDLRAVLNGSAFPSFPLFLEKLPIKERLSLWDGINALSKFDVKGQQKAKIAAKVNRQSAATAKK